MKTHNISYKITGPRAFFFQKYNEDSIIQESYPFITPSIARFIAECVFWQPKFKIEIDQIKILNDINYEISNNVAYNSDKSQNCIIYKQAPKLGGNEPKKHKIKYLTNVSYIIDCSYIELEPSLMKSETINFFIEKRCREKSYFKIPILGCRLFEAEVSLVDGNEKANENLNFDVPNMFYDLEYLNGRKHKKTYFNAEVVKGVVNTNHHELKLRNNFTIEDY